MSNANQSVSWYDPDSIRKTIDNARQQNVDSTRLATHLAKHDFDDAPIARVEKIVEGMPAVDKNSDNGSALSQSASTDAEPRDQLTKQLAVSDLEYVSNREAARLVGLSLEQFDGNTVRPPGTAQVETDIVWHRQRMTVALRVVPIPSGEVAASHVDALLDGTVVPDDTRSPSELAIVTNRSYTDEAKAYAAEHDIHCFDAGHVEAWFRRARIPMHAVGTVLEDGENHDGPLTDLVDIPPIPTPRAPARPIDIIRAFPIDRLDPGTEQDTDTERSDTSRDDSDTGLDETAARDDPLGGTQSSSGKTGTLYADPNEDGDYDVFDKFVDDIKSGSHQSDTSADDKRESQENEEESEVADAPSESATNPIPANDVDREELLFDLVDAKQDGGERMSRNDVQRHGSYPVEYYEQEFGSLADALDVVSIEYSEDSQ